MTLIGVGLVALRLCVLQDGEPAVAQERQSVDLSLLVERETRALVGRDYRLSPLGEGVPPDDDPRWRLDAFDCTTFAETAMALALTEDAEERQAWLDRIRYAEGPISFETRRHLMAAQWLPGLQALGLLREATDEVAGETMPRVRLALDLERWQRRSVARELELAEHRVPEGSWELPYMPLERLLDLLGAAPPGLLLNVVRFPSPRAPIVITHQALLVRNEHGERVVRHASSRYGRVVDQSIQSFVDDLRRPHDWPVAGLNLQRLSRPRPGEGAVVRPD